jgi:hypothetical protein
MVPRLSWEYRSAEHRHSILVRLLFKFKNSPGTIYTGDFSKIPMNTIRHTLILLPACLLMAILPIRGDSSENIVVRGSLVCTGKDRREVPCTGTDDVVALKNSEGRLFPLKSDKSVETLRTEKRIHSIEFQLTLRQTQAPPVYEIIKSQFVRNGTLYDFFYFCEVCNITTYHAGLCMCCREETEYREKPAP